MKYLCEFHLGRECRGRRGPRIELEIPLEKASLQRKLKQSNQQSRRKAKKAKRDGFKRE